MAVHSAELIIDKSPAALYVGHGEMVEDPVEAMKQAVKTARSNLQ